MDLAGINFYLSAILAIAFSYTREESIGMTLLIALIAFLAVYLALTLITWLFIIGVALTARKEPRNGKLSYFHGAVMNLGLTAIASYARIRVKVKGKDKLPLSPYLLVCNHRSNFDNFILSAVIKNPYLVFISKPENFKIPFVGRMMRRCGYLGIDRENPRAALKTINKAADMIKEMNAYVGVFPEGTRGSGEGVAGFSEGCFLVAKKAGCPIVIAVLDGTEKIHKRFPFTTTVKLEFLEVISPEDVRDKRSGELSDIAHTLIEDRLNASSGKDKTV